MRISAASMDGWGKETNATYFQERMFARLAAALARRHS